MLVSPNTARPLQDGTVSPMVAPTWDTGTIAVPVTQNGMIAGAWKWQTAPISGRSW